MFSEPGVPSLPVIALGLVSSSLPLATKTSPPSAHSLSPHTIPTTATDACTSPQLVESQRLAPKSDNCTDISDRTLIISDRVQSSPEILRSTARDLGCTVCSKFALSDPTLLGGSHVHASAPALPSRQPSPSHPGPPGPSGLPTAGLPRPSPHRIIGRVNRKGKNFTPQYLMNYHS